MKHWLVALLVVGAAACAPAPESPTDRPVADATAPGGPTAPGEIGPTGEATAPGPATVAALDFTADLVDGGQLAGGDLQGRDVVLWFWAPW